MPKVSDAHKDAVRRKILDAALVCLRRHDYKDMTTRELVAEAGISTGTFYNYFSSKEVLYEALAEEVLGNDIERVLADADASEGQSTGHALFHFLSDNMLVDPEGAVAVAGYRGRMNLSGDAKEAVDRLNQFILREFTPLVQKAQADGFLRDDVDAEAVVELFDIIWDGVGRRMGSGGFQTSHVRVAQTVTAMVLGGLLSPGAVVDEADLAPRPRKRSRRTC